MAITPRKNYLSQDLQGNTIINLGDGSVFNDAITVAQAQAAAANNAVATLSTALSRAMLSEVGLARGRGYVPGGRYDAFFSTQSLDYNASSGFVINSPGITLTGPALIKGATIANPPAAAPTSVSLWFRYSVGSGTLTLNTNLYVDVSRDNAAWQRLTLALETPTEDGILSASALGVDITGIASGTDFRWRMTVLSGLTVYIPGLGFILNDKSS